MGAHRRAKWPAHVVMRAVHGWVALATPQMNPRLFLRLVSRTVGLLAAQAHKHACSNSPLGCAVRWVDLTGQEHEKEGRDFKFSSYKKVG